MLDLRKVSPTKKVAGMLAGTLLALTLAAPAAYADSEIDVEVTGDIGFQTPGSITYDLSYSAIYTNWYVTEHSNGAVWNTPNQTNVDNPYTLSNNSHYDQLVGGQLVYVPVNVTVDFQPHTANNQDADTIANELTLNLTGDLAADGTGSVNINKGLPNMVNYTTPLGAQSTWNYGFAGSYSGPLTVATDYNPEYKLMIGVAHA